MFDRAFVLRDVAVPSFESVHRVYPAPWSYPDDLVSEVIGSADDGVSDNQRLVDLAQEPPEYEENEEYLAKVKLDLGIEVSRGHGHPLVSPLAFVCVMLRLFLQVLTHKSFGVNA